MPSALPTLLPPSVRFKMEALCAQAHGEGDGKRVSAEASGTHAHSAARV